MGKIKTKVASFVANKFFSKEVKELKESYYRKEKLNVEKEFRNLETSLVNMQKEYANLQEQKFVEMVNADLSKTKENVQEKTNSKEIEKDPFADWGK